MRRLCSLILVLCLLAVASCNNAPEKNSYGVFLSVTEDLSQLEDYETVVIDAQFYSAKEITEFKKAGHRVFSYINIGSLEDWRDYYDEDLTLAPYENWDEERWIDVSRAEWQEIVIDELIPELLDKNIDGFFVDNCDVYYQFPTPEILDGLTVMMKAMVDSGKEVIINGGDTFLDAYCRKGGEWSDVITGINQESVFSKILWDEDKFGTADPEDHEYFTDYIERYAALGADIYLLEYTTNEELTADIKTYCNKNGFEYYISDSLELD